MAEENDGDDKAAQAGSKKKLIILILAGLLLGGGGVASDPGMAAPIRCSFGAFHALRKVQWSVRLQAMLARSKLCRGCWEWDLPA